MDQKAWVVFSTQPIESPGPVDPMLYGTAFDPLVLWGVGSIDPAVAIEGLKGGSFAVAGGVREDTSGLGVLASTANAPSDLLYAPQAAPGGALDGVTLEAGTSQAVFLSLNGPFQLGDHLIGYGRDQTTASGTIVRELRMARGGMTVNGPYTVNSRHLACTTGEALAAAATTGDGWLMAYADGVVPPGAPPPGVDSCDLAGDVGSPSTLRIARVSGNAIDVQVGDVLAAPAPLAALAMAPRSDGAWLVFARASGGQAPALQAARIDTNAKLLGAPVPITGGLPLVSSLSVDHIGDHLVVAWVDLDTTAVHVARFDDTVKLVQEVVIPIDAHPTGHTSLQGLPGGALLVAWSSAKSIDEAARVHVAMLGCAL
jgi:hypothetical protein